MANPVTWFEIIGPDSERLQKFYRDALSWKLTPPVKEMGNYSMVEGHEPGIGGGIGGSDGDSNRVSVYFSTAEPQRVLDKALAAGARLLMPVTEVTPGTTIAMFTDPAGNTVGLMKESPRPARAATRKSTARPRAKKAAPKRAGKARAKKTSATKRTTKRAKRR
jgi:predicted enzyme related to lactoylglutathione lyase